MEQFHQPRVLDVRIIDQLQCGIDHLGDIVAGDVGRHAHRDAAGAIGEQIGEQPGEDLGLFLLAIVGRNELDRAFVQPLHQPQRSLGQPRLGVAVGGGVIAVDIAEIALPLNQWIAEAEILREPDHRVVNRLIAVRVILANNVAHNAGGLLERVVWVELQLPHRPQQPAMHWLQPIAQIGQRARGDRGERIDQIPLAERAVEGRVNDRVEGVFLGGVCRGHLFPVLRSS